MSKNFTRFSETIILKEEKSVLNIRVKPFISDSVGKVYFTDIQLQEGNNLTGYTLNTEVMLKKQRENGSAVPKRFYNGVVRSGETIVLINLGTTSAGLDANLYPIQNMGANSIELSQGAGAHKLKIKTNINKDDEIKIKAPTRECLKNGIPTEKEGFFQYSAAGDSKHIIKLEDKKSARVLFEFEEMQEGEMDL